MAVTVRHIFILLAAAFLFAAVDCSSKAEPAENSASPTPLTTPSPISTPTATPTSRFNAQAELLSDSNKTTNSPIGAFDFKNYTYELPRGWQNPDGSTEITLTNGHVAPIEGQVNTDEMSPEDKAEAKLSRRIGMSYVTTKFMDVTGDGEDEAFVILKIGTAGSAIPQVVYVFEWKDGEPQLIWPFRTGDRADGGLKDLRTENGQLVVELFGQDRFILGQTETGKITGDYEQLCCPSYFTRSYYKWNGKNFLLQGKRQTFQTADPAAAPIENMGEKVNQPQRTKRK